MLDIGTIVTVLSSLNFVGRFEVARNESSPYFCLCGINDSTNYIYNDNKTLEVGIEFDSEIEIFRYNISCPELHIFNKTKLKFDPATNTTLPPKFQPTQNTTELATSSYELAITNPATLILNCSDIDTDKLTYKCEKNELYQYLSGFIGIITFIVGLYLRPDLIWVWIKQVINEQYYGYESGESRIRNQL